MLDAFYTTDLDCGRNRRRGERRGLVLTRKVVGDGVHLWRSQVELSAVGPVLLLLHVLRYGKEGSGRCSSNMNKERRKKAQEEGTRSRRRGGKEEKRKELSCIANARFRFRDYIASHFDLLVSHSGRTSP